MEQTQRNVIIDDVQVEKDAWLEVRKNRIGSSDIASIAGLNKYRSPLQVWGEMRGEIAPQEDSTAMRVGRAMEPVIAEEFFLQTGMKVWRAGQAFERADMPRAMATPDYYVEMIEDNAPMTGILEIKNVTPYLSSLWEDGNIPDYAHCQILWQMGIAGIHRGIVCALVGYKLFWKEVKWSQEAFDALKHLYENFIKLVDEGTPPVIRAEDKATVLQLFEPAEGEVCSLDDNEEAFLWYGKYIYHEEEKKQLDAKVKIHKEQMEEAQANLTALMNGASRGFLGTKVVENKKVKRKAYEVKASEYYLFKIKDGEGMSKLDYSEAN